MSLSETGNHKHLGKAGKKGSTGLQAHLGGRHILKGDMAIGQFTGCDSHTVDIRLGIITLKILSQEKESHRCFTCSLVFVKGKKKKKVNQKQ